MKVSSTGRGIFLNENFLEPFGLAFKGMLSLFMTGKRNGCLNGAGLLYALFPISAVVFGNNFPPANEEYERSDVLRSN